MYSNYDFKIGFRKSLIQWLLLVGLVLVACIVLFFHAKEQSLALGSLDYICSLMKAEPPYDPTSGEQFRFPFTWFLLQLFLAWMVGKYPFSELYNGHGASILILGGSRTRWYGAKLLWSAAMVCTGYLVMGLTVLLFCLCCGIPMTWDFTSVVDEQVLSPLSPIAAATRWQLLMLPIFSTLAISAFQLFLSALLSPALGFLGIAVLLTASTYETTVFLPSNCSQLAKYAYFSGDGIGIGESYLALSILLVGSILIGIFYFQKKDILKKQ